MSIEGDITTALKSVCPRVFPDFADVGTQRPYITYQLIGGPSVYALDNTPIDKRLPKLQVNAWANTRLQANQLIREVESALTNSPIFSATPDGEPTAGFDEGNEVRGAMQDFNLIVNR
jgi:hypothetical protein